MSSKGCDSYPIFPLLNFSLVKISGDNAQTFLQGQFTCDVREVSLQKGSLSALCNHQGRVVAVFYLLKNDNDFLCLVPEGITSQFIQHLAKFAVFSKVKVEDVSSNFSTLGIIKECAELNVLQPYEVKKYEDLSIFRLPGKVLRFFGWSNQAVTLKETFSAEEIKEKNLAWKLIDILSGQANIYPQTTATVTPHMLNLHLSNAISFNKGCYVGQEIVARTHYLGKSKRQLKSFEISSVVDVQPGELIYANGQEVGVVMDSVINDSRALILGVIQELVDENVYIREGISLSS